MHAALMWRRDPVAPAMAVAETKRPPTESATTVLGTMSSGWQAASVGDFYGTGTADSL
jgi:hypothetical protein